MPNQASQSFQNNFIAGLKTEFTGLNFPENAATDTDNCVYTLIGDVLRREGIDYETNFTENVIDRTGKALSSYKWNNAGGDGNTQIVVQQVGNTLSFYQATNATIAAPLSTTKLSSTVNISTFLASGSIADPSITECQFTDGNGYLFVFHPNLDPFYCTFNAGVIVGNLITVQARDFLGIPDPAHQGVNVSVRALLFTGTVAYNLNNQGWGKGWGSSSSTSIAIGSTNTLILDTPPQTLVVGDTIEIISTADPANFQYGVVTSYNQGTGLVFINITQTGGSGTFSSWNVGPHPPHIGLFAAELGIRPSNSDVWWRFKDTSNVFNPLVTAPNVSLSSGPAPKGFFILNAFNQNFTLTSGVPALTSVATTLRPSTGTWFQGRVWYAGTNASVLASGTAPNYSWTENIYFSQIIEDVSQFGRCFQQNDPTSEDLFDLLSTDGGVITIQGSGSIYKLFPVQNGLLVFAANGIWFITGSQGIGFSATDYTITKISSVQSISGTSFINVLGYPMFWNEEGIYTVTPNPNGGSLVVENICVGTILSYYGNIPLQSKKFARGDYNPIDFTIQWVFRSTDESNVTTRYEFDKTLNLNTANKAFYPYSVSVSNTPKINGIMYVAGPGGSNTPDPVFKYITSRASAGTYRFSFAEEHDVTHFKDWFQFDGVGTNYTSYFIAGYRLAGKALTKWQPTYLYMFLRNTVQNAYKIQGLWDFAVSGNSGKWSTIQLVNDNTSISNFGMKYKRHKIRGHGLAFQLKVQSVDGKPFDIMGWTDFEGVNTNP